MVTINTSDDILRVLSENPEWKAAVRREILTEELTNLPARFDQFVGKTDQFVAEQHEHNARMDQFVAEQHEHNTRMDQFVAEQHEHNARMDQFVAEQHEHNAKVDQFVSEQHEHNAKVDDFMERTDRRFGRIERDISNMRGEYARNIAVREAEDMAQDMGLQMVRILTDNDIRELLRTSDTTNIATSELRSFRRADLIIETADDNETTNYIAVEVSNGADERDTRRAIRNAGFLTRFTGHPARAAIASVRIDDRIQETVNSGWVYWHELEDRDPVPE